MMIEPRPYTPGHAPAYPVGAGHPVYGFRAGREANGTFLFLRA